MPIPITADYKLQNVLSDFFILISLPIKKIEQNMFIKNYVLIAALFPGVFLIRIQCFCVPCEYPLQG